MHDKIFIIHIFLFSHFILFCKFVSRCSGVILPHSSWQKMLLAIGTAHLYSSFQIVPQIFKRVKISFGYDFHNIYRSVFEPFQYLFGLMLRVIVMPWISLWSLLKNVLLGLILPSTFYIALPSFYVYLLENWSVSIYLNLCRVLETVDPCTFTP